MTPRHSVVGTLAGMRWFDRFRTRAVVFGLLTVLALTLSIFPERYRAATSLTPADPASLGLSGTLGQLGAINNVFGNQAAIEIAMRIAKSVAVRDTVIDSLHLTKRLSKPDKLSIHRWLESEVTIRSLRGGIISIELSGSDPELARAIVGAYAAGTQSRLADISRSQTAYKRNILTTLVADASDRLAKAQANYDSFRLNARYSDPRSSIQAIGERVPALEIAIKAKLVQIGSARQLFTDDNIVVKQLLAELNGLRVQLAESKATSPQGQEGVGRLVTQSSQLFKLERELSVSKALYDSYIRYLQGTAVEDLASNANMRVLEKPYIDTRRQYGISALAAALALALLWISIEFYRLRPLAGARLGKEVTTE